MSYCTDVTDTLCLLLPGVEQSPAAHWLWGSSAALVPSAPLVAGALEPDAAEGLPFASLHPLLVHPVSVELLARYRPGRHAKPEPTDALRSSRIANTELVADLLGMYLTAPAAERVGVMMARAVRKLVADPGNEEWGGWALLAAATSLAYHRDVLPEPQRREHFPAEPRRRKEAIKSRMAFNLGRTLTLATAIALINS